MTRTLVEPGAKALTMRYALRGRLLRDIGSRAVATICLLIAAVSYTGCKQAQSADAAVSENDATSMQDLLFCAARRPFLIRLHLSVGGRGFRSLRADWADAQFSILDTDGNGRLEGDELKRFTSMERQRTGGAGESTATPPAAAVSAGGQLTPVEFRERLLAATGTPFSLRTEANNNVQVNLFPKLDVNGDGRLAREEISAAATRLRRYDRNEDDVISVQELQQALPEEAASTQQKLSGVFGLLVIIDPADQVLTSRRLLESYDKASRDPVSRTFRKDERLSRAELPIEAEAFDRADRNKDGALDRKELGGLSAAMIPSAELAIEAPSTEGAYSVRPLRQADPAQVRFVDVQPESDGRCQLVLNETAFSLRAAGPTPQVEQALRSTYLSRFKDVDQDKNDYLDRTEMQRFGFQETFFTQADTDGDGKLFEKEYIAHIDREIGLSKSAFLLEVSGDGPSLFRLIDSAPADGRLTLRELADAPMKLMQWDSNGDGSISLTELSITLTALFRAGSPRINGPYDVERPAPRPFGQAPSSMPAPTGLPSWFLKMDRNGDGDLSPKEFLGRRALFDQIDQNRDGLISADEAQSADRAARSN